MSEIDDKTVERILNEYREACGDGGSTPEQYERDAMRAALEKVDLVPRAELGREKNKVDRLSDIVDRLDSIATDSEASVGMLEKRLAAQSERVRVLEQCVERERARVQLHLNNWRDLGVWYHDAEARCRKERERAQKLKAALQNIRDMEKEEGANYGALSGAQKAIARGALTTPPDSTQPDPSGDAMLRDDGINDTRTDHRTEPHGDAGEAINIIFDGPPGPTSGRFVEVETDSGYSVRVGEWIERPDGLWALRIEQPAVPESGQAVPDGWVLVPREPTDDMLVRGAESVHDDTISLGIDWDYLFNAETQSYIAAEAYRAMIAVAPNSDAEGK